MFVNDFLLLHSLIHSTLLANSTFILICAHTFLCHRIRKTFEELRASRKMSATEPSKSDSVVVDPCSEKFGRRAWTFLHSLTAYYANNHEDQPDQWPQAGKQNPLAQVITQLAEHYPCPSHRIEFSKYLQEHPLPEPALPSTSSTVKQYGDDMCLWMCSFHNRINLQLGKPLFDCNNVHKRWSG